MKKERELSILYNEVLKTLIADKGREGICYAINQTKLTFEESKEVYYDFKNKNPRSNPKYDKFTKDEAWRGGAYWWGCDKRGKEQRILFLKTLIKEEERKEKSWWERFMDKIWWV